MANRSYRLYNSEEAATEVAKQRQALVLKDRGGVFWVRSRAWYHWKKELLGLTVIADFRNEKEKSKFKIASRLPNVVITSLIKPKRCYRRKRPMMKFKSLSQARYHAQKKGKLLLADNACFYWVKSGS